MMKKYVFAVTHFTLVMLIFVRCSDSPISYSMIDNSYLEFSNQEIQLQIDGKMNSKVFYHKNGQLLSLNNYLEPSPESRPTSYIIANGQRFENFVTDFNQIKCEEIDTDFGDGKRLTIVALAQKPDAVQIEQTLTVELYDDFPSTAIISSAFKNVSENIVITLDTVYSISYRLDASLVDSDQPSYSFYPFYGAGGRPTRQIETTLSENFSIDAFSGRPEYLEGVKKGNGGIPIIDLWTKKMGIGIGHIEPKWQDLYFPIKILKDGGVFIAVKEIPEIKTGKAINLKPGESYHTVRSFVNVHSLDFYHTVAIYSEMMKREGIDMHTKSTENDYLSAWCSWNDYSTHEMASKYDVMLIEPILDRLAELQQMTIKEIIFDAGWFNNQGDWGPNTDSLSFPGGETDLVNAIDKIHQAGFKVKLWISYLTADPWSDVGKSHPEWMIKKADGSFHLDRWSGYTMCPALPQVQEYYKNLADKLVGTYGADGFKVDGMYVCPPCYNDQHQHKSPVESSQNYYKVFESFFNQAKSINSQTTIMSCPCGTICDYTSLPYVTETIAADPESYQAVRRNAKIYRALKGSGTPYSSDYIDSNRRRMQFPVTLANAVGVGAVPQTFYGKSPDAEKFEIYKHWFSIYSNEMISKAEYLNLYDMYFDQPETYVFKKETEDKDTFYFSFYTDNAEWDGSVEFRGLDSQSDYQIFDYVNNRDLGTISGSDAQMNLSFKDYLLVKCIER